MIASDNAVPLGDILKWSLNKLSVTRRAKNGTNLRNNLLVTHLIFKTRNAILEQRTQEFVRHKLKQQTKIEMPSKDELCQATTDKLVEETVQKSILDLDDNALPNSVPVSAETELPQQEETAQAETVKSDLPGETPKRKRPVPLDLSSLNISEKLAKEQSHSPSKRTKEKENELSHSDSSSFFSKTEQISCFYNQPSYFVISKAVAPFGSQFSLITSNQDSNSNNETLVYLDLSNSTTSNYSGDYVGVASSHAPLSSVQLHPIAVSAV